MGHKNAVCESATRIGSSAQVWAEGVVAGIGAPAHAMGVLDVRGAATLLASGLIADALCNRGATHSRGSGLSASMLKACLVASTWPSSVNLGWTLLRFELHESAPHDCDPVRRSGPSRKAKLIEHADEFPVGILGIAGDPNRKRARDN